MTRARMDTGGDRIRAGGDGLRRGILAAAVATTAFSVLHHLEHVARDAAGWPFTAEMNGFTFTLLIYPVAIVGVWLATRGLYGAYHVIAAGGGLALVAGTHLVPAAGDPIAGIYGHYADTAPLLSVLAVGILAALLGSLAAVFVLGVRALALERAGSGSR